ncbi:hypothetical protein EJB05_39760, partial [Eragrostis curvula]
MATSSRCRTLGITATHNFEVTNFLLLDGMGIGKYVSSSTFSVGGCDWKLNFYPESEEKEEKESEAFASVWLCLVEGPAGTRVKFHINLFEKDFEVSRETGKRRRKEREETMLETDTKKFPRAGAMWGFPKFVKKSVLRELTRVSNDCFTIRCTLCVIKVHTEDADAVEVPQANLQQDLGNMLKDGEGADVTFKVDDQLFHAHRNLLAARSAVFKEKLLGAITEQDSNCIPIADMDPVFEGLLNFIYTDSLPDDWEEDKTVAMQHLLVVAHRYELYRLRALCEAKLYSWIDVQTVASTLALAEQQQCVRLKDACLRFIGCPHILAAIMQTEEFKNLLASFPSVTKEILEKVVSANSL